MVSRKRGLVFGGAACVALVGAGLGLGGCYMEGGPRFSADRFTYESRPWSPKTVSVVDTRTEETVWSVDVPVGQQLVISFDRGRGPNENKPDLMAWAVMEAGRVSGRLVNQMAAPPADARRVEMELRPVPEFADIEVRPTGSGSGGG